MSPHVQPVYTALVLHAHLPFVYNPDETLTLEENWFYEAMADVYLPFLDLMERLDKEHICTPLTLSVSPTLLAMWENPRMQRRTREQLVKKIELGRQEVRRLADDHVLAEAAGGYAAHYERMLVVFKDIKGSVITRLKYFASKGLVELIPSAATHSFLPLIRNPEAARVQLHTAVTEFRRHFGFAPAGIWLPECGYSPGLEPLLQELGLRFTVLDAQQPGGDPPSGCESPGPAVPFIGPGGLRVFTRDAAASAQVWSREAGYPGHPDYREYYRDIGYELGRDDPAEAAYIRPYLLPDGTRIATGYKYCRITFSAAQRGEKLHGDGEKAPYEPARAAERAAQHAREFLASRRQAAQRLVRPHEVHGSRTAAGSGPDPAAMTGPGSPDAFSPCSADIPELHAADAPAPYMAEVPGLPSAEALRPRSVELSRPSEGSPGDAGDSALFRSAGVIAPADRITSPQPVSVCAFDLELFGHWWHEGPLWLETLLREADREQAPQSAVRQPLPVFPRNPPANCRESGEPEAAVRPPSLPVLFITLSEYEQRHSFAAGRAPALTSWGRGGGAQVWLNPATAWMYPLLHAAEDKMILTAARVNARPNSAPDSSHARVLKQASREFMLAQSSDWAFMIDSGEMSAYAASRFRTHLNNFYQLLAMIDNRNEDSPDNQQHLYRLEKESPLFSDIDWKLYGAAYPDLRLSYPLTASGSSEKTIPAAFTPSPGSLSILVLSWEYPPDIIGGLGKAVGDLTAQLAQDGHDVHVVTCSRGPGAACTSVNGVHIHRVQIPGNPDPPFFLDWVLAMNAAMIIRIQQLYTQGQQFDLVHAHDWLVYYAAADCRQTFDLPLVTTLHATECGRKLGRLDEEVSRRIDAAERKLTRLSDRILVCSEAMRSEVDSLFGPDPARLSVIPNGLPQDTSLWREVPELPLRESSSGSSQILFIGRLVPEKNVQLLIRALPLVLQRIPEARLVIAGTGPMLHELRRLALPYGDRVLFTGFADEDAKARLFAGTRVCVIPSLYEPFGIVALEAMRAGVPIVASGTGGLADLIEDGKDGFKLPPDDPEAWSERICRLLEDAKLAASFVKKASRKLRNRFFMGKIAEDTVQIYQDAINWHESTKKH
ncbi:1,4-alpha-glucan branching protein domain-containing protein [Paenibacillus sp. FJAT-26967]|uniref:1,4-alpha-glucan branching protein domain-containing protein n=1 Tax=Paenibacillus sp. FJAT-26967 TaxID=1729690 RepID=UPI0008380422|nr:1,4-alpha-glucan branching protein domain-containing protein [Paenibacillus sp. FJAT-26967]